MSSEALFKNMVEYPEESKYIPLDDSEIEEIARGVVSGDIFPSFFLPTPELASVFLCLGALDDFQKKEMVRDRITNFYAYKHKSVESSRMIFTEHKCLNDVDSQRVLKAIENG